MVASVQLRTGRDLKRISTELRRMGEKQLGAEFRKELRAAAKPMVPAVKQAIRNIPSKQPYRPDGLRGEMVKAVKLEVKTTGRQTGVRIRVDGRKMPAKKKALQAYMEGTKRPWRHPVFGHDVWVQQQPKPYFYKTVRPLSARANRNIRTAANRVANKVT
ncbi:hypothetical protein EDD90_7397 [Streptomyces sp. Ag109_O5-1]|uniref:hypothetical protein n=1 Tax=Streptomyces sp. Ag109_O5-1 TaxID=1938851 RepID=UPI000F4D71BD|nr:hypothetical protein [Streptomyces sp. Ag109_O5-1]RPE44167.1 hypothetical protein EDD90_7397 [Streptomyces sp. Ag109_O5-1]